MCVVFHCVYSQLILYTAAATTLCKRLSYTIYTHAHTKSTKENSIFLFTYLKTTTKKREEFSPFWATFKWTLIMDVQFFCCLKESVLFMKSEEREREKVNFI